MYTHRAGGLDLSSAFSNLVVGGGWIPFGGVGGADWCCECLSWDEGDGNELTYTLSMGEGKGGAYGSKTREKEASL